jgi:pre-mRNA-splicing factor ISY1
LIPSDWEAAVSETSEALGLATPSSVPYPADSKPPSIPAESSAGAKRKAADTEVNGVNGVHGAANGANGANGANAESSGAEESAKKAKTTNTSVGTGTEDRGASADVAVVDPAAAAAARQAAVAASFLSVLDPESLKMPTMPTTEEMGQVLLEVRKKALREEYGV